MSIDKVTDYLDALGSEDARVMGAKALPMALQFALPRPRREFLDGAVGM